MLKFIRLGSLSYNLCQLYRVIKHPGYVSSRIINRNTCNSGFIIAGCCFSRQSDEETLLPDVKINHGSYKIEAIDNLQPQTSTEQHASDSKTMKRSLNDLTSQHANTDINAVHLANSCSKRIKTDNEEIDTDEKNHSVNTSDVPTNKSAELSIAEQEKSKGAIEKPKKYRPNYFVAVKITDDQIHQKLKELQRHMLEKEERLKKSMTKLSTLHITLMVLYIGDIETHARAVKALENIHQEHDDDLSKNPLKLEFRGLSHFQNRVLFAKLCDDDSYRRLSLLSESVKRHFASSSLFTTDSKSDFTPHLTVAKLRYEGKYLKKQKKSLKKIDPELYKDFSDEYFGSQKVQSIQLLSMTDPKDEDGYYSGKEIYFSAFEPQIRLDSLNKLLETEEKKKNVKDMINSLMKEKLK